MESILTSIKKLLGIVEDCTDFDDMLIIYINSAFSVLNQIGVGPVNGFFIESEDEKWSDFISGDPAKLRGVRTYVYLKVKLMFDPPQNSSLLESINRQILEHESRLNMVVDPGE